MDKFTVKLYSAAVNDLDGIYSYIASSLREPEVAEKLIDELENAIISLELFSERGPFRKIGSYAGRKYRQLFVKNFTIIYRIDEERKTVIIVTVRYSPSSF